jgi:hypothetical protein
MTLGLVVSGHAKSVTKGEDASFVKDDVTWRVPRHAYCANPAQVRPTPSLPLPRGERSISQSDGRIQRQTSHIYQLQPTSGWP